MHYADRLQAAIERCGNPCLVGLDPHEHLLPAEFATKPGASPADRAKAAADFLCQVIDLVAGQVPAVKPQSAFFELWGAAGTAAWERVVHHAGDAGLIVIGDVKRGDIGSTSRAYARAFLDPDSPGACDAITINPYLGADAIAPFVEQADASEAGIYVLVRTSNPGGSLFQMHGDPPVCERVADHVNELGKTRLGACRSSNVGAVVGATHPTELSEFCARMPHAPLLLPGYGAQGAGAEDLRGAFEADRGCTLVNSSRAILFAYRDERHTSKQWKDASQAALNEMIEDISGILPGAPSHRGR